MVRRCLHVLEHMVYFEQPSFMVGTGLYELLPVTAVTRPSSLCNVAIISVGNDDDDDDDET